MYIELDDNGKAVKLTDEKPAWSSYIAMADLTNVQRAKLVASELTLVTGRFYKVDVDQSTTPPTFNIVSGPAPGTPVSISFNGDAYIVGEITKVSPSMRKIETSDGQVFYRRKRGWTADGVFMLIPGHIEKRNPHI